MTYNSKRRLLGAIPVYQNVAYHVFELESDASTNTHNAKLLRKSKWHSQYSTSEGKSLVAYPEYNLFF